ncbi:DUF1905 domain-containing protein [Ohtaekwangia koreensis]|uniref:Bacteriocin-protection, YdeI or OmpD-Associated n=1 Tax=Ohtaekwangia koreensis TaxID=688867 RepID=A0A1T5LF28_9BACT|nr:YdeI/OmpD-associated family protein [Ohtaekwangia koreensis]SKC74269.1 Bacteriocin-protection, YdeI or OmpD-Associated [Ohtaekwangia koreensis]
MIRYTTTILKFNKKGEKSGWTYIEISESQAQKLKPNTKISFRVKGTLDQFVFEKVALLPMGDGTFIMPVNAAMRKSLGKKEGDKIKVVMEIDERKLALSADLMKCLKEEPDSLAYFKSLPMSHQNYYSKWIDSAKTTATKSKRIVMALTAFSKKQGFSEMIRENKNL